MFRKAEDTEKKVNVNMRGGDGEVYMTGLLKKDEFYDKGRLFSRLTLPCGSSIGKHVHEGEFECFYVLSGEGEFDDNGTIRKMSPGDVCYTASGEAHSVKNTGKENLELVALIIYK